MAKWRNDRVCFTINNYTDQDILDLNGNKHLTYLVYGREVGENGTPHLQGYCETVNRAEITWWKRKVHATAHFEPRRGTLEQAVTYCKKDGNVHEQGEAKPDRGTGKGKRNDLELVKKIIMTEHGSMIDIINQCTSYQALRGAEIMLKYRPLQRGYKPRIVHWYYGPTGLGKTRAAYEEATAGEGGLWISGRRPGEFMDGYVGQKNIIFDDFRPRQIPFEWLLRLLDGYPMYVEVKGGSLEWDADEIWITTTKSPVDLYTYEGKTNENIGQLERRIYHIRTYEPQDVVNNMFN